MVAQQVLVLFVVVRIRLGQHKHIRKSLKIKHLRIFLSLVATTFAPLIYLGVYIQKTAPIFTDWYGRT